MEVNPTQVRFTKSSPRQKRGNSQERMRKGRELKVRGDGHSWQAGRHLNMMVKEKMWEKKVRAGAIWTKIWGGNQELGWRRMVGRKGGEGRKKGKGGGRAVSAGGLSERLVARPEGDRSWMAAAPQGGEKSCGYMTHTHTQFSDHRVFFSHGI